MNYQQYY